MKQHANTQDNDTKGEFRASMIFCDSAERKQSFMTLGAMRVSAFFCDSAERQAVIYDNFQEHNFRLKELRNSNIFEIHAHSGRRGGCSLAAREA
jgi:hypothetical protein